MNFDKFYEALFDKYFKCLNEGEYYVYYHTFQDCVFYVGKGSGRRAWDKQGRNDAWKNFTDIIRNQYEVQIVAAGLTDREALAIERTLILTLDPFANVSKPSTEHPGPCPWLEEKVWRLEKTKEMLEAWGTLYKTIPKGISSVIKPQPLYKNKRWDSGEEPES